MSEIAKHIKRSLDEEISDLENKIQGLNMMVSLSNNWNDKRSYLTQIFNIEEKLTEIKGKQNGR
jgi:hypothetical protein